MWWEGSLFSSSHTRFTSPFPWVDYPAGVMLSSPEKTAVISRATSEDPQWIFRDQAKSGRDSGLKVCARGGMPNITLGITGLAHQILGRDYWIKEPYWRFPAKWNIRNDCRNSILMTCYNPDHLCQKWYIKGFKVGRQIWTAKDRKRICPQNEGSNWRSDQPNYSK